MNNYINTALGTTLSTKNLICLQLCNEDECYSISAQYCTDNLLSFKEIVIYYDNKETAQKELLELSSELSKDTKFQYCTEEKPF